MFDVHEMFWNIADVEVHRWHDFAIKVRLALFVAFSAYGRKYSHLTSLVNEFL